MLASSPADVGEGYARALNSVEPEHLPVEHDGTADCNQDYHRCHHSYRHG
jgi:hypothetical protein